MGACRGKQLKQLKYVKSYFAKEALRLTPLKIATQANQVHACKARLAVNTVHMFANICSRSQFTDTVRNQTRCEHAEGTLLHTPRCVHTMFDSEQYLRTAKANRCSRTCERVHGRPCSVVVCFVQLSNKNTVSGKISRGRRRQSRQELVTQVYLAMFLSRTAPAPPVDDGVTRFGAFCAIECKRCFGYLSSSDV